MELKEKIMKLEELFEIEAEALTSETELSQLDNWDSITKLSLIVFMEDEFHKKLTSEQIRKFITIKDILDFID